VKESWPPLRLHWGVASALLASAVAGLVYYRGRTPRSTRQQTVTAPSLDFKPRWDAGRQQIGPAGSLDSGSGLRLISRLEMGIPRLDDDHLVGTARDMGGLWR
jgi:hypothetical protein